MLNHLYSASGIHYDSLSSETALERQVVLDAALLYSGRGSEPGGSMLGRRQAWEAPGQAPP